MSNRIYFTDNRKGLLYYLILSLSEVYRYLFPNSAEKRLRRILLTPQSRKPTTLPESMHQDFLDTPYGKLACYSIGREPINQGSIVLFVHGWSGSASQFFPLMEKVVTLGYTAIAFDHYQHGHSTGKENNYPLFVKAIGYIVDHISTGADIKCIVSHSMGSSATFDVFRKHAVPQFAIAPMLNLYEEWQKRITGIGISQVFFEKVMGNISEEYDMCMQSIDIAANAAMISGPIHVIHSVDDQVAQYDITRTLAEQQSHITLETITGIGHMKIVGIPETQRALTRFIEEIA